MEENLCRLCLNNENLIDLFPLTKETSSIISAVKTCYDIQIRLRDAISKKICKNCIKLLLAFQSSSSIALLADKYLKDKCERRRLMSAFLNESPLKAETANKPEASPSSSSDSNSDLQVLICSQENLTNQSLGMSKTEPTQEKTMAVWRKKGEKVKNIETLLRPSSSVLQHKFRKNPEVKGIMSMKDFRFSEWYRPYLYKGVMCKNRLQTNVPSSGSMSHYLKGLIDTSKLNDLMLDSSDTESA